MTAVTHTGGAEQAATGAGVGVAVGLAGVHRVGLNPYLGNGNDEELQNGGALRWV